MPRIYRVMKSAEDGRPVTGRASANLGVRIPKDIIPIEGDVEPNTGGMSVRPSLKTFPVEFIPERLRHLARGARGRNSLHVWKMGEGLFENALVTDDLRLHLDASTHGLVEPSIKMSLEDYEIAIFATRELWTDGEAEE